MKVIKRPHKSNRSGILVFEGCNVKVKICNCVFAGPDAVGQGVLPLLVDSEQSSLGDSSTNVVIGSDSDSESSQSDSDEGEVQTEEICGAQSPPKSPPKEDKSTTEN